MQQGTNFCQPQRASLPLAVEGTFNLRDLGGYATEDGRCTRPGLFFRSDGLQSMTPAGKEVLLALGIDCVVDLRSHTEARQAPEPFSPGEGPALFHISMEDDAASNGFASPPDRMGEMYIGLLAHSAGKLGQVFRVLGDPVHKSVLFHCSAGKDRTGVVAMLLLKLARVPRQTLLNDYAVSYQNLLPLLEVLRSSARSRGVEIPEHVLRSDPAEMELALDWLEDRYPTAEEYLTGAAGVEPALLANIKARFLEDC